MKKLSIYLTVIVGLCVIVIGFLYLTNIYRINNKFTTGTVRKLNSEYWGIETNFPRFKISILNLPEELRAENLKVRCRFSISDVIGTSDWDIYAEASQCRKK